MNYELVYNYRLIRQIQLTRKHAAAASIKLGINSKI